MFKMLNLLRATRADHLVERVRTNSILNPLLWLIAIIEATSIPAAVLSTGLLQYLFFILAASPVMIALFAYVRMMYKDPDRLQSEEYLLERYRLAQGTKQQEIIPLHQSIILLR